MPLTIDYKSHLVFCCDSYSVCLKMLPNPKSSDPCIPDGCSVVILVSSPTLRLVSVGDVNPSSTLKATTLIEGT